MADPTPQPTFMQALHDRVAGSGGASTIWGIIIGALGDAVITIVNSLATSPALDPKYGHAFALVAMILGALWPAKKPDAPKGFARLGVMALLAIAAIAGCKTLTGASSTTTVTTRDGKSYNLTVGDAGGCLTSSGAWYQIPNTNLECNKVCIDTNPGAVIPGATCRVRDNPASEFTVVVPIPTK